MKVLKTNRLDVRLLRFMEFSPADTTCQHYFDVFMAVVLATTIVVAATAFVINGIYHFLDVIHLFVDHTIFTVRDYPCPVLQESGFAICAATGFVALLLMAIVVVTYEVCTRIMAACEPIMYEEP